MNVGIENEFNIIKTLNKKYYFELSDHWKIILKKIFPFILNNDFVRAFPFNDRHAKPDITILCRNFRANISIKTGHNPSIHQEFYYDFFKFLEKNNVSRKTIRILYFYHFGMTKKLSNNGIPFSKDEIVTKFKSYIISANREINSNVLLLKNLIYRAVCVGCNNERIPMDYFYYGNKDNGFILNYDEIVDKILNEKKEDDSFIHFGGLIYQPSGRKVGSKDRFYSRIKWPVLCVDFYNYKNN